MKIVKTHYDNYLGIFQVKKVNSFFAINVFVAGVWDILVRQLRNSGEI